MVRAWQPLIGLSSLLRLPLVSTEPGSGITASSWGNRSRKWILFYCLEVGWLSRQMLSRQMLDWALGGSFSNCCSLSEQSDREIHQGLAVLWDHSNERGNQGPVLTIMDFVKSPGTPLVKLPDCDLRLTLVWSERICRYIIKIYCPH